MDRFDLLPELKRKGFTQRDIARKTGFSRGYISLWFSGQRESDKIDNTVKELLTSGITTSIKNAS